MDEQGPVGLTGESGPEAVIFNEAEGVPVKLRVLVWAPLVGRGGLSAFLSSWIRAVSRNRGIALVRVLHGPGERANLGEEPFGESVQYQELPPVPRLTSTRSMVRSIAAAIGLNREAGFEKRIRSLAFRTPAVKAADLLQRSSAEADIVYSHFPNLQDYPEVSKPVVCTMQDTTMLDFPEILGGSETEREWERTERWVSRCAGVVVGSQAARRDVARHFRGAMDRVRLIRHDVLPPQTGQDGRQKPSAILSRLPPRFALCVTNPNPHKNLENLFSAWTRLRQEERIPLVLVGPQTDQFGRVDGRRWPTGPQTVRVAGAAWRAGLKMGRDWFGLGYVSDEVLAALFGMATMTVIPSLKEGGGSYPLETALSMGVPVACSRISALEEQVAGWKASVTWFDPQSVESMRAMILRTLSKSDDGRISRKNRHKIVSRTWDDVAGDYVRLFLSVYRETRKNIDRSKYSDGC